ncbi:MAG TPA: cupin domain-containing protein [Gaiellaceae bacterium]|jgi:mannose-6-phosphate isomerase-like protein (cupin superfamily)|nr:cupin domain-containing protein [Gaiellaceae bacterium]
MPYDVASAGDHRWEERPAFGSDEPRHTVDLTTAAGLGQSRARFWRLPAHARGRRHSEGAQEEVFVVIEGTLTILLGDPPERFDLEPQSVVSVKPGTALQLRNETDSEVVLFAYGAPPVAGQSAFLDDVEL